MRFVIRYICIFTSLLICCSCDLEELKLNNPSESTIDFIARPADYSNVDVTTKSDPTDAFETAIHTAYLLLFDADKKRIHFSEVDPQSRIQRITIKGLSSVTACFVANVAKNDIKDIMTLDAFNSIVLNLNYATYSQAGGHLGVPVLSVNGNEELCFPMVGVKTLDVSQVSQAIEIPLTRLFAKVSVQLTMNMSLSTTQSSTRFELKSYKLVNLPKKVSLLPTGKQSEWVTNSNAFAGDNSNVASDLTNNQVYNNSYALASDSQKKYTFDVYVPEYCLTPLTIDEYKGTGGTEDTYEKPEYKPKKYDSKKKPVQIVLTGSYIPTSGSSTNLDYSLFLGEDESLSFTLNRNVHYNNYLTIKGITKNADNKDAALIDHRVKMSDGNMVSMFGEVANCYVINATGTYSFPAYKGAYKADDLVETNRCTKGTKVEIIAQNGVTTLFATDDSGKPKFTLTTNPAGEKVISFDVIDDWGDANVIIGLKDDSGNVEWSWHLWFVKGVTLGSIDIGGFFQMKSQAMPNGVNSLMDRNLGAMYSASRDGYAGAVTGLYYRYGQIAPYFTDTNNKSAYHGHTLPDNSSWVPTNNKKSPNDPCPPGYRVPHSDVWKGNATLEDASLTIPVINVGIEAFRYWNSNTTGITKITDDIYFPYCAYVDSNNSLEESYDETTTISGDYDSYVYGTLMRAYNINYSYTITKKFGILSTNNNKIEKYKATNEGFFPDIVINSCKYQTGTKIGKYEFWGKEQSYDKNNGSILGNIQDFILTTVKSELEKVPEIAEHTKATIGPEDIKKSYGYQVRCVKE